MKCVGISLESSKDWEEESARRQKAEADAEGIMTWSIAVRCDDAWTTVWRWSWSVMIGFNCTHNTTVLYDYQFSASFHFKLTDEVRRIAKNGGSSRARNPGRVPSNDDDDDEVKAQG